MRRRNLPETRHCNGGALVMFGNSAANSLGECASSIASPGAEAPSPLWRWIERVLEDRR